MHQAVTVGVDAFGVLERPARSGSTRRTRSRRARRASGRLSAVQHRRCRRERSRSTRFRRRQRVPRAAYQMPLPRDFARRANAGASLRARGLAHDRSGYPLGVSALHRAPTRARPSRGRHARPDTPPRTGAEAPAHLCIGGGRSATPTGGARGASGTGVGRCSRPVRVRSRPPGSYAISQPARRRRQQRSTSSRYMK